ncbi:MAG: PD-(D/E)XK nuclease family protein [Pleurocapsa minor GSE-CHR-MK-17-07R]|jgi:ATP-dependent helicase/DNAse subunit B|nr:PD-(D/E)XK nuclease family protein [Pleurocapsa minor GSE-CHR-MK 17-07R]
MPAKLYTAAVSGGKTTLMQQHILSLKARQPLARVWVLTATERQIHAFRTGLIERAARPTLFNIEFFNFYAFYQRVLAAAGKPQRALSEAARRALVRSTLRQHPETVFAPIADTAGLPRILDSFFVELKQNLVSPDTFTAAATNSPKQRDLAVLYSAYSSTLQDHKLVDRDGEGWVALDALADQPRLFVPGSPYGIDLLVVDGYDQFQTLQAALIAGIAARVGETHITLTQPDDRAAIGKRFTQARKHLQAAFDVAGVPLDTARVPDFMDDRPAPLRYVSAQLMRAQPTDSPPHVSMARDHLLLCEAPSAADEVRLALAHVKHLLLKGESPESILIALHAWTEYAPQVRAQAGEFGIPITFHRAEPLAENPAIAALMQAIELPAEGYRRRELLDALRSPYITAPGLDDDAIRALESISQARIILGGREQWLTALEALIHRNALPPAEDEDAENAPPQPQVDYTALRDGLASFFTLLEGSPRATFAEHVDWLEALIGDDPDDPHSAEPDDDEAENDTLKMPGLGVLARARATPNPDIIRRDMLAMRQLKLMLRGLIEAHALTDGLSGGHLLTREAFVRDLRAALAADSQDAPGRDGRVLATTLNDARGLPHDHVIMTGLSESLFPAPAPADPLLLDSERDVLIGRGIPVSVQSERSDDIGLFYEILGQTRISLMLTRPTTRDGSAWMPSPIWTAILRLFPGLEITHLKAGSLPDAEDCHTPAHAAVTLAAQPDMDAPARAWFMGAHASLAARIASGWRADIARVRRQRGAHTGVLHEDWSREAVRERLHEGYAWSASQLEALGTCGFRFFAGRMLGLLPLEEPEAGMQAVDRGSIAHSILENAYATFRKAQPPLAIQSGNRAEAVRITQALAEDILKHAPERYGFTRSALWDADARAIAEAVTAVVEADFEGRLTNPGRFAGLRRTDGEEIRFGGADRPLSIALDDDLSIPVKGVIDRIDRADDDPDSLLIIDYKWRTMPSMSEYERGRNFQMMLYMLAGQALFKTDAIAGTFVSIVEGKTTGDLLWLNEVPARFADDKHHSALDAEHGKAILARNIRHARDGDFASEANGMESGQCAAHCDYARLCRIAIMARRGDA